MKITHRIAALVFALSFASSANAAEIKVLCSNGIRAVVEALVPQFERATGHKVVLTFEPSSQLKKRIDAGEPFDLTVLTPPLIDAAIKDGKIAADSRTVLARSGLGLSMRAGVRKPDVSSVDAFKHAPFEALVAKLGIAAPIASS